MAVTTKEQILAVCGKVQVDNHLFEKCNTHEKVLSPGMKYRHYAPKGQITIVEGAKEKVANTINTLVKEAEQKGIRVAVLCAEDEEEN